LRVFLWRVFVRHLCVDYTLSVPASSASPITIAQAPQIAFAHSCFAHCEAARRPLRSWSLGFGNVALDCLPGLSSMANDGNQLIRGRLQQCEQLTTSALAFRIVVLPPRTNM